MPWRTVTVLLGSSTRSGIEGDGIITVMAGGVMLIATLAGLRGLFFAACVVCGAVAVYELIDVATAATPELEGGIVSARPGLGLLVVAAGAAVGLVYAFSGWKSSDSSASPKHPPES